MLNDSSSGEEYSASRRSCTGRVLVIITKMKSRSFSAHRPFPSVNAPDFAILRSQAVCNWSQDT